MTIKNEGSGVKDGNGDVIRWCRLPIYDRHLQVRCGRNIFRETPGTCGNGYLGIVLGLIVADFSIGLCSLQMLLVKE